MKFYEVLIGWLKELLSNFSYIILDSRNYFYYNLFSATHTSSISNGGWQNFSILSTMLGCKGFILLFLKDFPLSEVSSLCDLFLLPHGGIGVSSIFILFSFLFLRRLGLAGECSLTESLSKL